MKTARRLPTPAELRGPEFNCGHQKTADNTLINRYQERQFKDGEIVIVNYEQPRCRTCHNKSAREYYSKKR